MAPNISRSILFMVNSNGVFCVVFCTVPSGYPRVIEPPTLKAVEKDRHTMMACSATGVPEPTIMWLKDFIPVDITDPRLRLLPTGGQESYTCIANKLCGRPLQYAPAPCKLTFDLLTLKVVS